MLVTNDRKVKLPYAHYSDLRWKKLQLVFEDKTVKCTAVAYDDRLADWDRGMDKRGVDKAKASSFPVRSAAWFEAYLQGYWNDPSIKIGKVYTGCNTCTGYQYWCFAWSSQ